MRARGGYVCVCMCMYQYVCVCIECISMYDLYEQTRDIFTVFFFYYVTVPVVEWHIWSHMIQQAGVRIPERDMVVLLKCHCFLVFNCRQSCPGNKFFLLSQCQEQHTYKYINIRPYTCTYIIIHISSSQPQQNLRAALASPSKTSGAEHATDMHGVGPMGRTSVD